MNLKLLSGKSNPVFAEGIAKTLNCPLTGLYLKNFPSGESYCQIQDNIRGDDVYIINGITMPANENLMDICIIADAARRASAQRITAVIPYFGYARQDRKDKSRVPISAKLVMDILTAAGIQRVVTMDLHSPQIAGFTNLPLDHLAFEPILLRHLKAKMNDQFPGASPRDFVIVAPDVGAIKRAEAYAKALGISLALIVKNRLNDSEVEVESFVGNVTGKVAIIIDDLTESCGTIIQAGEVCRQRGAKHIIGAVSHFCPTDVGRARLTKAMSDKKCPLHEFIHSDTVSYPWVGERPSSIQAISVEWLFSMAIHKIHNNQSVSSLFES